MKTKILIPLALVILSGIAFIFYFFYSEKVEEEKEALVIYGNVDIRQVDLGFRVFGRVTTLYFDEGDEVMPGQLMAQLDRVPYNEQVDAARGRLSEAKSAYDKAKSQFDKRFAVDPDAISEEDYDDAFYNLEEMQAAVVKAEAELATALTNLGDTDLFCPTEGTILTRIREPGSVLEPGVPVFTLSIKSPLWIRTYVTEPELGKIYFGMPAKVYTDTESCPVYHGQIGFISPVAEFTPKTVQTTDLRTDLIYRLRVVVNDPDHFLKQGMPVTVKLKLGGSPKKEK